MELRDKLYDPAQRPVLEDWLRRRKLGPAMAERLPKHGRIVYHKHTPVAAGFLRACEGKMAFMDGYLTDPDAPAAVRNAALDLLTTRLIGDAKELGFSQILAFSIDKNTIIRSQKLGFSVFPYTVVAIDLSKEKAG